MTGKCDPCQAAGNRHARDVVLFRTGETVCNNCPRWRQECEERDLRSNAVLLLPTKEDRRADLEQYGETYGPLARERLEAEVIRKYRARMSSL